MNNLLRICSSNILRLASTQKQLSLAPVNLRCKLQSTASSPSSAGRDQKLYELRIYSLQAKDIKMFYELSQEWMHLRLSHSKLVGYWTSEIGGLNDVVHIWEYDSLQHRAGIRQALAGDQDWVQSYFSKLQLMLVRQENSLLLPLPGTSLVTPPSSKSNIYELEVFGCGNLNPAEVSAALAARKKDGGTLLGSFYGLLGPGAAYQLWQHPDQDSVIKTSLDRQQDGQYEQLNVQRNHSRLLLPVAWSPLQ